VLVISSLYNLFVFFFSFAALHSMLYVLNGSGGDGGVSCVLVVFYKRFLFAPSLSRQGFPDTFSAERFSGFLL